jgi:hypothetical protein
MEIAAAQLLNAFHDQLHALFRIILESFLAFYMAQDFSIVRFLSHVVMCV